MIQKSTQGTHFGGKKAEKELPSTSGSHSTGWPQHHLSWNEFADDPKTDCKQNYMEKKTLATNFMECG